VGVVGAGGGLRE
jgi:hypothetical protein